MMQLWLEEDESINVHVGPFVMSIKHDRTELKVEVVDQDDVVMADVISFDVMRTERKNEEKDERTT